MRGERECTHSENTPNGSCGFGQIRPEAPKPHASPRQDLPGAAFAEFEMSGAGDIDIDSIIERLLSVLSQRPGKMVNLEGREIKALCMKSREIFISQPVLLELEAPIKICGTFQEVKARRHEKTTWRLDLAASGTRRLFSVCNTEED